MKYYFLITFAVFLAGSIIRIIPPFGSKNWPKADAVVTDDPVHSDFLTFHTVNIVYSYHFEGNLYTGRHREPAMCAGDDEFLSRFPKGRTFVVRVKQSRPNVSFMRDDDQRDGVRQLLDRIDRQRASDDKQQHLSS